MACYHPLKGFLCQASGSRKFTMRPECRCRYCNHVPQTVPCGQCVGCRLERSRQWAVRCLHEASLYERNCFITLTYDAEHLPPDSGLYYDHFQKFMKRLRFAFKGHRQVADGTYPIRFYMCGEYGEKRGRPHFHSCIFNFDFEDKKLWKTTDSGFQIFRSKALEELWPFGFSSIGGVSFESAAYVARYIMKKMTGKDSASHYDIVDPSSGEVLSRRPEFNKMSLKPGIGAGWFDKFKDDVFKFNHDGTVARDAVSIRGRDVKPPRFYDRRFAKEYPALFEEVQLERSITSDKYVDDNTTDRLLVKEQVTLAKIRSLKRKLL